MSSEIKRIAKCLVDLYDEIIGDTDLKEMKLHKLLYFAQKTHYLEFGEWLFEDEFEGWVHGPVNKEIRSHYPEVLEEECSDLTLDEEYSLREVIFTYGTMTTGALRNLSHEDLAYENSRRGLSPTEIGTRVIKKEDIIEDIAKLQEEAVY
ncbi:MAG: type II toxin-antitoxin system antitoxin SocA domain-containing protein [Desemzia incerta]|uniref:Panacea domain-containing protein n=1 Tax=Desemzia incerta TaxID=82801 RepID=UPI003315762B